MRNENFSIFPFDETGDGLMFVDHEKANRSGHLGHALVEYEPGKILAFYSNCSSYRTNGHNGFGWVEYKRSLDCGKTWGEPTVLPYSYQSFINGIYTISCEKAVVTDHGTIVLFCLRNSAFSNMWEPFAEPTYITSTDGGESWSEPKLLCEHKGRVYDACYKDGVIYALEFCNEAEYLEETGANAFFGHKHEDVYRLYVSEDNGEHFELRSIPPFDTSRRAYGALQFRTDGSLIAYAYNVDDEYHLDYLVSEDGGVTWGEVGRSPCAKRIRNPQTVYYSGLYYLFGRSGCEVHNGPLEFPLYTERNFVLYTSKDAINWDGGEIIRVTPEGCEGGSAYYSNGLVTSDGRLLIQASDAYSSEKVNIKHWWIDAK